MIEGAARALARMIVPRAWRPSVARLYERLLLDRRSPRRRRFSKTSDTVLDCCIAYNDFGGYCVPLAAVRTAPAQAIFNADLWEPDTIAFIRNHCEAGDVVHAGAYFGDALPAISDALTPSAKLWAFEPNPDPFRCAVITKTINKLNNVELVEAALSDQQGTADIVLKIDDSNLAAQAWLDDDVVATAHARSRAGSRTIVPVRTTTIDAAIPAERDISIIHLDLEGHEPRAIAGAINTISRCRPILIVELWYTESDAWLIETLSPIGYKVTRRLGHNVVLTST